ncbi:MAG: hypothetical protein ACK4IT_00565 [Thioalkalivibrionaceae bacterium]
MGSVSDQSAEVHRLDWKALRPQEGGPMLRALVIESEDFDALGRGDRSGFPALGVDLETVVLACFFR